MAPTLPTHQAFLAAGITVAACFLLVYLSFEALIFQEINGIYSRLEHIKRKEFKKLSNKFLFRPEPLQRIGDEIVQMAERRQQELDELKRLQALRREFLADVSHELKTPLFAAQGFVHTILDEEEADPENGHGPRHPPQVFAARRRQPRRPRRAGAGPGYHFAARKRRDSDAPPALRPCGAGARAV
ncbi:MAG: histidine kinase dimerization/phospho-acceptor domain-containing protein [Hymenobacter sp.]